MILAAIGEKARRGCYVYLDSNQKALYVGKSKDLKSRLIQQATPKGIETKMEWSYLGVIFNEDDHLLEQTLIAQLNPEHNILSKNDNN